MQQCCVSTQVASVYALHHMCMQSLYNVRWQMSSQHSLQSLSMQHGFGLIMTFSKELCDSICPVTVADSVRLHA